MALFLREHGDGHDYACDACGNVFHGIGIVDHTELRDGERTSDDDLRRLLSAASGNPCGGPRTGTWRLGTTMESRSSAGLCHE